MCYLLLIPMDTNIRIQEIDFGGKLDLGDLMKTTTSQAGKLYLIRFNFYILKHKQII